MSICAMFPAHFLLLLALSYCCVVTGLGLDDCRNGRHNNVHYVNDRPTHCIINNVSHRRGMCVSIDLLYETLSSLFKTRQQREFEADRTREFKRYLLQHRGLIYSKSDEYDDNSGVHERNGFNTLFMNAGILFTETHPETHVVVKNQTSLGAEAFCDLALRHFPVANNRLYSILPPTECPPPVTRCSIDKNSRFSTTSSNRYPKHVNLVWYANGFTPEKCYVPMKLNEVDPDPNQCITFQVATDMLNAKDNGSPAWQKNDYLSALRRNYLHPEPGWRDYSVDPHRWTDMRDHRLTIGTILKKIESALGYRDDPEMLVNITSRQPYQPALETVKLSVHAFCAAIVEIIPFSRDEIRRSLSNC